MYSNRQVNQLLQDAERKMSARHAWVFWVGTAFGLLVGFLLGGVV